MFLNQNKSEIFKRTSKYSRGMNMALNFCYIAAIFSTLILALVHGECLDACECYVHRVHASVRCYGRQNDISSLNFTLPATTTLLIIEGTNVTSFRLGDMEILRNLTDFT